jgi:hypothetical protein
MQTEATHAFVDGVRGQEVKQHLLMGGDRSLNEALNQALMLEAAKAAAGPPARLRKVTRTPMGTRRPVCWHCGKAIFTCFMWDFVTRLGSHSFLFMFFLKLGRHIGASAFSHLV